MKLKQHGKFTLKTLYAESVSIIAPKGFHPWKTTVIIGEQDTFLHEIIIEL